MIKPRFVLFGVLAAACCSGALAQAGEASALASTSAATVTTSAAWRVRQSAYFKRNWGVDIVGVRPVSSGLMLAFRYRVLDADKAKALNDSHHRAYLRDEATGTVFAVPALENVGELRTGTRPEAGRTYYMIFGNPGRTVKSGSRISIVAGDFHADGMIVD